MSTCSIVTLDIGGTKVNFGRYRQEKIEQNQLKAFNAHASAEDIVTFLIEGIKEQLAADTIAIAIGVPTIVDIDTGRVFDAVNIPAWQNYPLKDVLSEHFDLDIYINNDVNCFVAGEVAFGRAKQLGKDVVGICLGTGFGSGYVLNGQLYSGHNCCAGELGGIPYLQGTIDDYCSGSFFKKKHQVDGAELAVAARSGDQRAIDIYHEFGCHLAKAISYLMFVVDPNVIVVGGSVAKSFDLFIDVTRQELAKFPYKRVRNNLHIVQSTLENAALLGAASLYLKGNSNQ